MLYTELTNQSSFVWKSKILMDSFPQQV